MQKNDTKIKNFFDVGKSVAGKVAVFTLVMVLIFTAYSGANLQNPESITTLKNQGRSIVWDVTMHFINPGGQNDYVVFGEAPDANDGPPADIYDVAKPPAPMPPYIRAYLKDNLPTPYTNLWRDYRQYPDSAKVWNLSVKWEPEDGETPTTITMSWSTAEVDESEYTSVNLCTNAGVVLKNMLVNNTYTFTCPASVTQNFKIICSAASINNPPVFGTPSPANGSASQPLSLTWSIPINDPEGNLISWTIQCNNGQTNSGTNAANGTRSLTLSGLAYLTTYKVWVNATDSTGSGLYTRRWYTFTTKAQNFPPVFGTPSPANGSTSQPLSLIWSISINDPEGNTFAWTIQCSNGQTNTASGATNGTKTLTLSSLAYLTLYKVWVNATDPAGSNTYTRKWYTFTTKANLPPVFGTPSPVNGSTGNLLSLTWSIPINDPEGNTFTWSIQCSNGQVSGGSGASNGTKSLALSGLAYLTTYKVWVNATDPTGSNTYTRRWYMFTTKAQNFPPVFGTPSPVNGSTSQPLSLTWSISINDPEGNLISWTIQCSNGQTNSATGASNGTKTLALTGLAYSTTYKVWVNATDPTGSGLYTRRWYTFTTKANLPPVFGTPSPVNGSTGNLLSLTWSIPINDPEGNSFNWWIQCSNGQTNTASGATNGTKSLSLSGLAYLTTYKVWVNATDPTGSNTYTRRWYTFTTKAQNFPPVFGTPSPANGSTSQPLSLTWSIPINDPEGNTFTWTIQCNNGQTNSGSGATNGTKTLTLSGLAYSTIYKVWVNATDPTGSNTYTRKWYTFTTKANLPPVFGTPSPVNGSTSQPLSLTWSISINDPEGNTFTWSIQCSNGQVSSGTSASNGTKSLVLSGLAYLTTYKVWVNATDPTGSNTYTRRWFTFTTKAQNFPPVFGTPSPVNGSTSQPLSLTWSIPINDPEGNTFTWTIQCSNGQTSTASGASNGTKTLTLSGLAYSTTYKVWVNATDPAGSGLYTRRWYTFTTQVQNFPPVFGTPSPVNGSTGQQLSLTWGISINDPEGNLFSWTIQCSNGQVSSGTSASNGTKSLSLSGLAYLTTYKVWVNATDPTGSNMYTRKWYSFTTEEQTEFSVQIKGGFGVKMVITNTGTSDATGVTWQIHVQGGILKLINKTKSGTIDIAAGTSKTVSTGLILGLGSIIINTQVADGEKTANGFVLFFLVLGVKENASLSNWFSR